MRVVVVAGVETDRSYALSPGTLRVVGRQEGLTSGTSAVARDRQRALRREDLDVAAQHLAHDDHAVPVDVTALARDEDIDLLDDAVSQTHALLLCTDAGLVVVVDVASKNGTYVNGARVDQVALVADDVIRVGETRLRVDDDGARRA